MHLTITELPEQHALGVVDADLPLVNASRQGDVSAFEKLVNKYDRKLYRIAQSIMHNHEDAEEVVQTAFLKVLSEVGLLPRQREVFKLADSGRYERIIHAIAKATFKQRTAFDKHAGIHSEQSETRSLQHPLQFERLGHEPGVTVQCNRASSSS